MSDPQISAHEPDAVVETTLVHDVQRRATTLLANATSDPSTPVEALATFREFVVAMLRHHHESEDRDLWVLLVAAAPALNDPLVELTREHDRLDAALDRLEREASAVAAEAVRGLVHEHLAREEPVLFPAMRAHLTDGDWESFSRRTVATAPKDHAYLLVGLAHLVAGDDTVGRLLRHLPPDAQARVPEMRAGTEVVLAALGVAYSEPRG